MKTLGVRELRASYSALETALKETGEVILTHHGNPFARALPIETPGPRTARRFLSRPSAAKC